MARLLQDNSPGRMNQHDCRPHFFATSSRSICGAVIGPNTRGTKYFNTWLYLHVNSAQGGCGRCRLALLRYHPFSPRVRFADVQRARIWGVLDAAY